jgi:hypothetical protein
LFAGSHEKNDSAAQSPLENPQMFYGVGDMAAVNASGIVNLLSFPFMVLGFVKSVLIGRKPAQRNGLSGFVQKEVTAARLYGAGYIIGALTSLVTINFAIAQMFWALAYFSFKRDT